MDQIKSFLEPARLARKQTHLNMAVFPILAPEGEPPDYLTLDEAIERQAIEIMEVSEGGDVPNLKVINLSAMSVLIVEGEELIGAKQNRIVNSTFLVAGRKETVIPVSCVEQGRWSYRSPKFESSRRMSHASLRRSSREGVNQSLMRGEGYRSDQGRVWSELAEKQTSLGVDPSPTGAMSDMFEQRRDWLEDYRKAFQLVDMQVGALFAINGEVLGLECFGHKQVFGQFFDKLVGSYALDAIDWLRGEEHRSPVSEQAKRFLASISEAKADSYPSVGLGENIRFETRTVSGAALVEDERLLHLTAFKKENGASRRGTNFQRFSERRQVH
ncbi:MAG: hypothetical protein KJ621_11925 [Proteobacteria bacterium]|nr:hypothetical protein [Pseudomonadota bacterium]